MTLGLITPLIPLIVIGRTTLTDAFRSIGVSQGMAPFAQHRTRLGRFLVGSTVMRVGYSASKVITFCGLALADGYSGLTAGAASATADALLGVARGCAWIAVGFCVLRGLPVIVHSLRHYWRMPVTDGA